MLKLSNRYDKLSNYTVMYILKLYIYNLYQNDLYQFYRAVRNYSKKSLIYNLLI